MADRENISKEEENKSSINKDSIKEAKRLKDIKNKEDRQKAYKDIKAGKTEGYSQGVITQCRNLKPFNEMTKEERSEISKKGAAALHRLRGERKDAKTILNEILPLYADKEAVKRSEAIPQDIKDDILKHNIDITHYHLLYLSMLHEAENGNTRAAEFIRDTYGDKPINETHNINEIMTESDKALIEKIQKRLNAQ